MAGIGFGDAPYSTTIPVTRVGLDRCSSGPDGSTNGGIDMGTDEDTIRRWTIADGAMALIVSTNGPFGVRWGHD
jgi:hypothetical protein